MLSAPRRFSVLLLLLLLGAVMGCRTYGGYGTESATLNQIQQANDQFARELERARADLNALEEAAQTNAALKPFVAAYRDLIDLHQAKLEENRRIAAQLEEGDETYRDLSRDFGAILAEERVVNNRYTNLHRRIQRVVRGEAVMVERVEPSSRYYVTPPYYARAENLNRTVTMQDALRGL